MILSLIFIFFQLMEAYSLERNQCLVVPNGTLLRERATKRFFLERIEPPSIENKKEMQTVHLVLSLFYELVNQRLIA